MTLISNGLDDLESIAGKILTTYKDKRVFALTGAMGAGKTTLTKVLCEQLGVIDVVNSPTFAIVNEYLTASGDSVFHFDCYRLKNLAEFLDIGGEDYLYSGNYCFIEWPQIIEKHLPEGYVDINIAIGDSDSSRIISVNS
ncbi:MAG: tRNA (adenosine(37)-N6)-threonylcarbamoyltransferase complex ATPase subunit type 1 TsaE [Bacteroidales bacterium]|jgi:tRNA threonylcarbamoyladenosine biosynthesis protein TsaE|nr:tRNA (adenosine(37)-N6)-threonylcarbamoyltransferase complex ATPase subunit type 1 TsaE [Bacteroidales bacterium]